MNNYIIKKMDNRGGTSIEELMRGGGQNSQDDDDVINSILSEINSDKEQQQQQQQQQLQMKQQQQFQIQQQAQARQREMEIQQMKQQNMMKMEMENMKMMEKSKDISMCENISILDEFKSSIIFFIIFMLLNLTQINNLICGSLSIENNNIFILLKTFVATVIFFFLNKLIHKYI